MEISLFDENFVSEQLIDGLIIDDKDDSDKGHCFMFTKDYRVFYNQYVKTETVFAKAWELKSLQSFHWREYYRLAFKMFFAKYYYNGEHTFSIFPREKGVSYFRQSSGLMMYSDYVLSEEGLLEFARKK